MPFIQNTPESLLPRSDSKNPAATCSGLTAGGRPCRRAISSQSITGGRNAKSLKAYCWQHKDQEEHVHAAPQGLQSTTIKERTSIDTLAERLGLLDVSGNQNGKKQSRVSDPHRKHRRDSKRAKPSQGNALLCCIGIADEEQNKPRPVKRQTIAQAPRVSTVPTTQHLTPRPIMPRDPPSRTREFLRLIPKSSSPETTSLLLAELSKPISESDEEGYIYMFWLTSETLPAEPPSRTASSLLDSPPRLEVRPNPSQRRTSDVLKSFSESSQTSEKTMLLKIGRAANVQRRLNQWSRQCGYNLSLIRYYPYQAQTTSTTRTSVTPGMKVPHAHKVERLIHIELARKRAQGSGKCTTCGREHREWFEVEATRDGVKAVDEVVRRWVDWGLKNDR